MEFRQRPRSAEGAFWYVGGGPRDDLIQLADLSASGVPGAIRPTYSVAGHLIAKMLGGLDEPENLVNVTKQTNDRMQRVENELKHCADPHWLKVSVTGYYDQVDKDPRVPTGFHYEIWKGGTRPPPGSPPLKTWKVVQDWLQVAPLGYDGKLLTLVAKLKSGLKFGFSLETLSAAGPQSRPLHFLAGCMPPNPGDRPLAVLDYALLVHPETWDQLGVTSEMVVDYVDSLGSRAEFGLRWVRDLAVYGNILAHGNVLVSDVYGQRDRVIELGGGSAVIEPHQFLIVGGGANAPQVDHILPLSLGGSNCFSNAQVTSQQYNGQKGNPVKILEGRSDKWKQDMLEKMRSDPMLKGFV